MGRGLTQKIWSRLMVMRAPPLPLLLSVAVMYTNTSARTSNGSRYGACLPANLQSILGT